MISSITLTDTLLYSLHDNDASNHSNTSEARQSKYCTEWLSVIHEELESLKSKGIYKDVDVLPPGRKAVACKWVLHVKCDKDGSISCFKSMSCSKRVHSNPQARIHVHLRSLPLHVRTPFAPSCASQLIGVTLYASLTSNQHT